MERKLIKIRDAARMLNVSIDTLRRWDKGGKLKSIRLTPTGHRSYDLRDLTIFSSNVFDDAQRWVTTQDADEPDPLFYCSDSPAFNARLHGLEKELLTIPELANEFSLITSVAGEIGNNSFDHNLGSWPDVRGIYFGCDLKKRQVVLADRGQGILTTLRRVRPDLANDEQALFVAFTETVTGRAPEGRGNGLKYVRAVVTDTEKSFQMKLVFHTGSAMLTLQNGDTDVRVLPSEMTFHGCLAWMTF